MLMFFTSCMNFCIVMVVRKSLIKVFPNSKPWVTKEVKVKLTEKRKSMSNKQKLKCVQKEVNVCIKMPDTEDLLLAFVNKLY